MKFPWRYHEHLEGGSVVIISDKYIDEAHGWCIAQGWIPGDDWARLFLNLELLSETLDYRPRFWIRDINNAIIFKLKFGGK